MEGEPSDEALAPARRGGRARGRPHRACAGPPAPPLAGRARPARGPQAPGEADAGGGRAPGGLAPADPVCGARRRGARAGGVAGADACRGRAAQSRMKPIRSYIASSVGATPRRPSPRRARACGAARPRRRAAPRSGADRVEQPDDRLGHVLLERAVAGAVVAGLDLRERLARGHRHDLDQVRDAGLVSGSWRTSRPESVTALLIFLRTTSGGSSDQDRALGGAARGGHLLLRLLEIHDPRPDLRVHALGHDEGLAEARVEALGDVARELEVLALVVADRDDVGLVQQDVARHQHRVGEQAGADELLLVALVLELGHPAELAVARDGREQPGRLGVRRHVALAKTVERSGSSPVASSIANRS